MRKGQLAKNRSSISKNAHNAYDFQYFVGIQVSFDIFMIFTLCDECLVKIFRYNCSINTLDKLYNRHCLQ